MYTINIIMNLSQNVIDITRLIIKIIELNNFIIIIIIIANKTIIN